MGEMQGGDRNYAYVPVISFFSLFLYLILFLARSFDDNRTASWQYVFTVANPSILFSLLVMCLPAGWLLSRISLKERSPSLLLFGASFAISALFWSEPEVIVDASRYFAEAKYLEVYGVGFFLREWGRAIPVWTDLPVVPFFYGLIFKVFGESRFYIQIFTSCLFSLSIVLTCQVGKKLWDADTGFYAGLLLLGIPYLYTQVPLMLVDVPSMFFLLLAIFSFLSALEKGNALRILLSSFAITLAFYSKYSLWLMLSVLIIIALTYRHSLPGLKTSVYLTRALAIALASAFLVGAVFIYHYDPLSEQIRLLLSYQRPGLQRWGESFLSTFFFQIHPLITLAAAYSLYEVWRRKDIKYLGVLWLVALVFFFQIRRIRYIIMVFPMLTLMASYGLQRIRQKEIIRFITLSVVAMSIAVGVFAYLPFLRQNSAANLANAGKYLDSLGITGAEVFTISSKKSFVNPAVAVPVLDLFTKKQLIYNYVEKKPYSAGELSHSPFRFSWEYKNPRYYTVTERIGEDGSAVVLIFDGKTDEVPEGLKQRLAGLSKKVSFDKTDNVYEYQTFITIYYR